MHVKVNHHIFRLEITVCNSLCMQELNSFEKLPAEIGSHVRRECVALVEGFFIWHGNNGVTLSGENDGERDGVVIGGQSAMQEFKQLDLICTCIVDTFQYSHSIPSGGVCNVSVLRIDQNLGHYTCESIGRMHIPGLNI